MTSSSTSLPPIDISEFEPRPSTPVRSRSSPDKRPICSGNLNLSQTTISNHYQSPILTPKSTPFTPTRKTISNHSIYTPSPKSIINHHNTPINSRQSIQTKTLNHSIPVLLPASAIRPKAKLTAEAIPRRKQLLPGAPNPSPSIFSRSSSPPKSQINWTLSPPSSQILPVQNVIEPEEEEEEEEEERIDENVLVAIRVRPGLGPSIWNVDKENGKIWESGLGSPGPESCFDAVFGSDSSNEDVYKSSAAKDLIRSTMKGYDSTIFAYGQTASGKTFTLTGDRNQPGIIPLAVKDIFEFIRAHPSRDFLLRASYLEIYNEQINDLLIPNSSTITTRSTIKIRQDPITKHFFPSPIREEVVTTEAQVEELLLRGENNRHVSGTDWNSRSSRSHTVFALVIESRMSGKFDGIVRRSKVCLIDLAGSERAASDGARRAEGAFINKSLLTLEKVIGALAEPNRSSTQHVPFRDSKLTQILQPSLSGDAKVCVICTMNPSASGNALEESRGTLRFARRVKRVAVKAGVKEILSERALITRYRQQIVDLQSQLSQAMSAVKLQTTPNSDERKEQQVADAEAEREDILSRLNKLQSIVLNAANLDREQDMVARPVSPTKPGGRLLDDEDLDEEDLRALTVSQAETIEDLRTELETYKRASTADLIELAELKVIVSNLEPERVESRYERRLKLLEEENGRRKAFGEEMVNLLEAAQMKAKKLELFIINELQKSVVKSRERPRRSSISTYLPDIQTGQEGDRLLALLDERPEVRCVRASFGNVEIDLDG
ncbi:hypothetical protein CROQUDRAFT_658592 [Cronartium quercuum f. sp. fusiforme G11]|uniref:Kinesin-like protein n=1 Tax=Cronartium quercuum f. sp. fusiforme G11 TaxID=708437 RepID=A0A9P6TBB6_9BASI|nr:hypothetical protein CROQUDRAFT_658592 [Cronartium quercuum f. sp. fusiforme G11]